MISTEYSTLSHLYCLRICSVFFWTKVVKESILPETFSPAFFFAAIKSVVEALNLFTLALVNALKGEWLRSGRCGACCCGSGRVTHSVNRMMLRLVLFLAERTP